MVLAFLCGRFFQRAGGSNPTVDAGSITAHGTAAPKWDQPTQKQQQQRDHQQQQKPKSPRGVKRVSIFYYRIIIIIARERLARKGWPKGEGVEICHLHTHTHTHRLNQIVLATVFAPVPFRLQRTRTAGEKMIKCREKYNAKRPTCCCCCCSLEGRDWERVKGTSFPPFRLQYRTGARTHTRSLTQTARRCAHKTTHMPNWAGRQSGSGSTFTKRAKGEKGVMRSE